MKWTSSNKFTATAISVATMVTLHGAAYAAIPGDEKDALIAIYDATGGDAWTNKTGWKTASDPCTWHGITCDAAKTHITKINLTANNLVGTLPAAIGDLPELDDVRFTNNKISGSIPAEIGNLKKLANLYIDRNALTGSIPTEIGNMTKLQLLGLGANQLTGSIPATIGNLADLETIYLNINRLSGTIPTEITNLTNLKHLYIDYNSLQGDLPDLMGQLQTCASTKPYDCSAFNYNALTISSADASWAAAVDTFNAGASSGGADTFASTQTIAPKNVTKGAVSETTIDVSWDLIDYQDGIGSYIVTAEAPGKTTVKAETVDKKTNTLQLTGLTASTEYSISVKSKTVQPGPDLGVGGGNFTNDLRDIISLPSKTIKVITSGTGSKPSSGSADANKSSFTVSTSTPKTTETVVLTVIAKDSKGTRLSKGGDSVKFTISPTGSDVAILLPVKDHNNGSYTASLTGKKDGEITVTASLNGTSLGSQKLKFGNTVSSSGGGSGSTGIGLLLALGLASGLRRSTKK